MSVFVNDIDALLDAAPIRNLDPRAGKVVIVRIDPGQFLIAADGTPSPAFAKVTTRLIGLKGVVEFAAVGCVLTGDDAGERYLAAATMTGASARVTATVIHEGETYSDSVTISRAFDGAAGSDATLTPAEVLAIASIPEIEAQIDALEEVYGTTTTAAIAASNAAQAAADAVAAKAAAAISAAAAADKASEAAESKVAAQSARADALSAAASSVTANSAAQTAATDAISAAAASQTSRLASEAAFNQASQKASAAVTSAQQASGFADASSASAAAAHQSALAAAASAGGSANDAGGSAQAAAQSASNAATSATAANQSAAAAQSSRLAAEAANDGAQQAKASASNSASGAATSATGAATAESNAYQNAQLAAQSKLGAEQSAGAAAGSASTAGTKATLAGTSADAANAARVAAEAARDAAGGSANAASTSASTASAKADAASTSASSASTSANTANTRAAEAATFRDAAAQSATAASGYAQASAYDYTAIYARLNNAGGAGVTVEQRFSAQADAISGLSGQAVFAVNANGQVAGIKLAATSATAGATSDITFVATTLRYVLPGLAAKELFKAGMVNGAPAMVVNADLRADGEITARSLRIGSPDNVVPDPNFEDPAWWGRPTQGRNDYLGSNTPWKSRRAFLFNASNAAFSDSFSDFWEMTPGATYKIEYQVYISGDFNGAFSPIIHLPAQAWYTAGQPGRGYSFSEAEGGMPVLFDTNSAKGFFTFTHTFVMGNATAQKRAQARLCVRCLAGYIEFGGLSITRMSDNTLITDDGVTTPKLAALAVVAEKIASDAVQARHVASDTMEARHLKSDVIQARHMTANSIETDFIVANGISSVDRVYTTSYTFTSVRNFKLDITVTQDGTYNAESGVTSGGWILERYTDQGAGYGYWQTVAETFRGGLYSDTIELSATSSTYPYYRISAKPGTGPFLAVIWKVFK